MKETSRFVRYVNDFLLSRSSFNKYWMENFGKETSVGDGVGFELTEILIQQLAIGQYHVDNMREVIDTQFKNAFLKSKIAVQELILVCEWYVNRSVEMRKLLARFFDLYEDHFESLCQMMLLAGCKVYERLRLQEDEPGYIASTEAALSKAVRTVTGSQLRDYIFDGDKYLANVITEAAGVNYMKLQSSYTDKFPPNDQKLINDFFERIK